MSAYSLRRNKMGGRSTRASRGDASCESPMVDLTVDSDAEDDSCCNATSLDATDSPPRLVTSRDGHYESLSSPLMASLCVDSNRPSAVNDVKVAVKWSTATSSEVCDGEKAASAAKAQHATSSEPEAIEKHEIDSNQRVAVKSPSQVIAYEVGEKIFAWDRQRCGDKSALYEAKVLKLKAVGGGFMYYIHYLGYKKSHERWLANDEMLKMTEPNRKMFEDYRQGHSQKVKEEVGVDDRSNFDVPQRTICIKGSTPEKKEVESNQKVVSKSSSRYKVLVSEPPAHVTIFEVGENIFAWERGIPYEAKVISHEAVGDGYKYHVHYLGHRRKHYRWLTPDYMSKRTQPSPKIYDDCTLEDDPEVQVVGHSSNLDVTVTRSRVKKSPGEVPEVKMRAHAHVVDNQKCRRDIPKVKGKIKKESADIEAYKRDDAQIANETSPNPGISSENEKETIQLKHTRGMQLNVAKKSITSQQKGGNQLARGAASEENTIEKPMSDGGKPKVFQKEIANQSVWKSKSEVDVTGTSEAYQEKGGNDQSSRQQSKVDVTEDCSLADDMEVQVIGHRSNPDSPRTRSKARKFQVKVPEIGMRVYVRFEENIMYGGKVVGVKERHEKNRTDLLAYDIKIHYDDGDIADETYPDPDISLDPDEESIKLYDEERSKASQKTRFDKQTRQTTPEEDVTETTSKRSLASGKKRVNRAIPESEKDATKTKKRSMADSKKSMTDSKKAKAFQKKKDNKQEKKQRSEEAASETKKRNNMKVSRDSQPDIMPSDNSPNLCFGEADYAGLYQRYLMPRVREKVELASGMTLRRQCKGRMIDQDKSPGFRLLKSRVDVLLRKNQRSEIYRLLCQLRDWELNPQRVPDAFRDCGDDDVEEIHDLTKEEDGSGNTCIDLDEYITDVLLVSKKKGCQNLLPLQTPSNPLPECTTSGHQPRQISFDDEPAVGTQSVAKPGFDSSDNQEGPSTHNSVNCIDQESSLIDQSVTCNASQQVNITRCGMEEIEACFYTMIAAVGEEIESNQGRLSASSETSVPPASANTASNNEPTCHTEITQEQILVAQNAFLRAELHRRSSSKLKTEVQMVGVKKEAGIDSGSNSAFNGLSMNAQSAAPSNSAVAKPKIMPPVDATRKAESEKAGASVDLYSKNIRWNDIPKPPGQRTIDDCRGFYIRKESNANPTQPLSRHSGLTGQQIWPVSTNVADHNLPTNHINLLGSASNAMPTRHSRPLPPQTLSNLEQNLLNMLILVKQHGHNFSPILPGMNQSGTHFTPTTQQVFALPIPKERLEQQPCPKPLPPKLEARTRGPPASMVQPTSLSNDGEKPRVAQVVTPDMKTCCNGVASGQKQQLQRKNKKRRQSESPDRNPKKKLHFSVQVKTGRFFVAGFAFPSTQNMRSSTIATFKRDNRRSRRRISTRHRGLQHAKGTINNPTFAILPPSRIVATKDETKKCSSSSLQDEWKKQVTLRKKGKWVPNGHLTGRWKAPAWANANLNSKPNMFKHAKYPGCKRSLLPKLDSIIQQFLEGIPMKDSDREEGRLFGSLQDVICPQYVKPTFELLRKAHLAVESLLPEGDCEDWRVVQLCRRYYNHWRPKETKVILLAESHAFTSTDRALRGPGLDEGMLPDTYHGPRGFVSLVYCLAYGENESLTDQINDKANKGTSQFWTLFAACSRGVGYVAPTNAQANKSFSSPFAADLLKGGGLPVEQRLKAKLEVLEDLRDRGIWLLDASIFGWYISQPQQYTRSSISNEVHRKAKSRPPMELKRPNLVLSWELFTKHLIKEVANEGHLKLLVPIGMEVEAALTRPRMEDAIKGKSGARVTESFPAPNAWIPGGYGPFHAKLAKLVNENAPKITIKTDDDECMACKNKN